MALERKIELGTGHLDWHLSERFSNRYGTIRLWKEPITPLINSILGALPSTDFSMIHAAKYGQLIANVLETHRSYYRGDPERNLYPVTPNVGEVLILGEGILFTECYDEGYVDGVSVGLIPIDNRDRDWLIPKVLYRLHNQKVTLYFNELDKPSIKVCTN